MNFEKFLGTPFYRAPLVDASVDLVLSRIITQSCSPVIIDFSIHFPCQWSRLGNLELNYEEHVLRACEHVLRI